MELTKEHLDQALGRADKRLAGIDSRFDAVERKIEASRKDVIHKLEAVESSLARRIADGLVDVETRVDVRPRVAKLEHKVSTVESALNIKL